MFTATKTSDRLLEIEIGGKITADEMKGGLDQLIDMLKASAKSNMLAIYHEIEMPEGGAIIEELKRLPEMFGLISHIDRVALVSPQKWVRDMAELEGKVLPGVTIRSFTPDQRAAAEAFVTPDTPSEADRDIDMGENFPV